MKVWNDRADIYDFVFADRKADAVFYLRMAKEYGGPVLEGGCATGRILLPIAREGITVHGMDSSEAMLERFREKLRNEPPDVQERVQIRRGDLLQPIDIKETFSLIFLAFGTFGLFLNDGEAEQVLRSLSQRLKPGGRLIIERRNRLSDTYFTERRYSWTRYWPERKCVVVESQTSVMVDDNRKIREQTFFYDIVSGEGQTASFRHRIYFREFSLLEMEQMLEHANLENVQVFGDYDCRPFEPCSPRIIIIAENRRG